jgi:hypothetical protein
MIHLDANYREHPPVDAQGDIQFSTPALSHSDELSRNWKPTKAQNELLFVWPREELLQNRYQASKVLDSRNRHPVPFEKITLSRILHQHYTRSNNP